MFVRLLTLTYKTGSMYIIFQQTSELLNYELTVWQGGLHRCHPVASSTLDSLHVKPILFFHVDAKSKTTNGKGEPFREGVT